MASRIGWLVLACALSGCLSTSGPAVRTPFETGREAAAAGDYRTAIAQLTLAVDTTQGDVLTEAHLERGECHLAIAETSTAPSERDKAIESALADFEAVLEEPTRKPKHEARALCSKGAALMLRTDAAGAEACFRRVLDLRLEPADLSYRVVARRKLGWMDLEAARATLAHGTNSAESVQASREAFRRAQENFSECLAIEPSDEDCLLGKGLSLYFRGQHREALEYLERSTQLSDANGIPNARGHYYLARTLEEEKGRQPSALEHYTLAVEQDPGRQFTALYADLVDVLPKYLDFDDPRFGWFLDNMLRYRGDSGEYWEEVERLADRLVQSTEPPAAEASPSASTVRGLGIFARAMARARGKKVQEAVQDSLLLADDPQFLDKISRIFPTETLVPEYILGKALTLLGAKRYPELEDFFAERAIQFPPPSLEDDDSFRRTLVIHGQSIVERWLADNPDETATILPEAKLERDKVLGRARDAFMRFLDRKDDAAVRLSLGRVQELMEAYAAAFSSYAMLARASETNEAALGRILDLHSRKLLSQPDMAEAWNLLRSYSGSAPGILEYVRQARESIRADVQLHCTGCGRKGLPGETMCMECGRQIGSPVATGSDRGN